MFRTLIRHGVVVVGLALLAMISPTEGQSPASPPARAARPLEFQVLLPADAQLELEGVRTSTTGAVRHFRSPAVPVGSQYAYSFVATWRGQTIRREVKMAHDRDNIVDWRAELEALAGVPGSGLPLPRAIQEKPLIFQVLVPADAQLLIDEFKTNSTGETRRFESPSVPLGKVYGYTVTAIWRGHRLERSIHLDHDGANVFDWRADLQALAAGNKTPAKPPEVAQPAKPTPSVTQPNPPTIPPVASVPPAKAILEIVTTEPDFQVVVKQDGKAVAMLDAKTLKKVELDAGKYDVALGEKFKDFRLSTDSFSLKPGEKQIVMVQRAPRPPAAPKAIVEIITAEPDVQVIVQQNGKPVAMLDAKKQKKIEVAPGKYELKLGDSFKDLQLSADNFTVKANEKQLVLIQRHAKPADPMKPVEPMPPAKGIAELVTAEPELLLTLKQDGKTVATLNAKDRKKIELPPGKYDIEAGDKFKDFRLSTDSFTLQAGEKQIILAQRPPKPPEPPTPAKGTVEIVAAEPSVQVIVHQDGKAVAILDAKNLKKIDLQAGLYDLKLGDGSKDFKLSTERFALKAGEKVVVAVDRLPKPAVPKKSIFTVESPPAISLQSGQTKKLSVKVKRENFADPIRLTFTGVPKGVTFKESTLPGNADSAEIEVTADKNADSAATDIQVVATSGDKAQAASFPLKVQKVTKAIKLILPPDVTVQAGDKASFDVKVERTNVEGPLSVRFEELPAQVVAPPQMIDAGKNVTTVRFAAEAEAESSVKRVLVKVSHGFGPDAIVTEGRFALHVNQVKIATLHVNVIPNEVKLQAGSDKATSLKVKVKRDGFTGPVTIRFVDLPEGVTIREVTIPADKDEAETTVGVRAEVGAVDGKPIKVIGASDAAKAETKLAMTVAKKAAPPTPTSAAAGTIKLTNLPEVVSLKPGEHKDVTLKLEMPGVQGKPKFQVEGLPDKTYWYLLNAPPKVTDDICTQVIRFGAYEDAAAAEAKAKVKATANGGAVKDEKTIRVKVAKE